MVMDNTDITLNYKNYKNYILYILYTKVKLKQSRYRPGVAQRVPIFHDNGRGWW
jgi:hypothetical protein